MRNLFMAAGALVALAGGLTWLWFSIDERIEPELVDAQESAAPEDETEREPDEMTEAPEPALQFTELAAPTTSREEIEPPPIPPASTPDPESAIVRGVLTDSATGEPLPDYHVSLGESVKRLQKVVTDASGRFETPIPLHKGRLYVTLFDSSTGPVEWEKHDHPALTDAGGELALRVASGPTFRLMTIPARDVAGGELMARLRGQKVEDEGTFSTEFLPVRRGEPDWVRFPPIARADHAQALEVRSPDGIWIGEAAVSAVKGIVPGVVSVTLDARAVLTGAVTAEDGAHIAGAEVTLRANASSGRARERPTRTDDKGRYRFELLRAGSGTVLVRDMRFGPADLPVTLAAREVTTCDATLARLPTAGSITGRLASQTGQYDLNCRVRLELPPSAASNGRSPPRLEVSPKWKPGADGRKVADFTFSALPVGQYRLSFEKDDWFEWEPREIYASPPSESSQFLVRDDVSTADLAFRARDTDDGAALNGLHANVDIRNGPSRTRDVASGEAIATRLPLDRRLRWRLDKDGYQPAFGDERDFAIEEMKSGRLWRFAEVDLRAGWGDAFRIVQRNSERPIAGAKLFVDGREAGASGNDGIVRATALHKPERVEVDFKDWKVNGRVDLRPIWKRGDARVVTIRMDPPPKKK